LVSDIVKNLSLAKALSPWFQHNISMNSKKDSSAHTSTPQVQVNFPTQIHVRNLKAPKSEICLLRNAFLQAS